MVATDGFRLSVVKMGIDDGIEKEWLVPAKSVMELIRLIGDGDDVALATVDSGNQVVFALGEIELSSRLVGGTYPDYRKILPETGETVVEMSREELLRACKLAGVFARESSNIVKFDVGAGRVMVSANASSVGGNEVTVDAKVSGDGGGIAFNYRYLLDYLNVVDEKGIIFEMSTSLAPGLWKTDGAGDFAHVIMPVRLEEAN